MGRRSTNEDRRTDLVAVGLLVGAIGLGWLIGARNSRRRSRKLLQGVEQLLDTGLRHARETADDSGGGPAEAAAEVGGAAQQKLRRMAKRAHR